MEEAAEKAEERAVGTVVVAVATVVPTETKDSQSHAGIAKKKDTGVLNVTSLTRDSVADVAPAGREEQHALSAMETEITTSIKEKKRKKM